MQVGIERHVSVVGVAARAMIPLIGARPFFHGFGDGLGTDAHVFEETAYRAKEIDVGGEKPEINGASYVAILWPVEEMGDHGVAK